MNSNEFILKMLRIGNPLEVSLVGVFETEGRGSKRDIDLPLHRDGDYTTEHKGKIDVVGLYCIKPGTTKTVLEVFDEQIEFTLQEGQALIFDNKICRHGRFGPVCDRLLLRMWISRH